MGESTSIVLATDQPDGVVVVEVVAPERVMFAAFGSGNDENAQRLLNDFARLNCPPTCPMVLDLRGVDGVNSGGFALIMRWWKQAQAAGRPFGLCLSPSLRELLAMSRLDRVIPCFNSISEAISGLSPEARGPAKPRAAADPAR